MIKVTPGAAKDKELYAGTPTWNRLAIGDQVHSSYLKITYARSHPYPIPQPVKVGHTTGVYDPYSFRIVMGVLLRLTRTNQCKCCETGTTVFCPFPKRLEMLTICRCHYKGSTFFSVI